MIELNDVGMNYGGGALFDGVTLSLPAGSFHFLTGPSGAGKTTLLKLCYLALRPTSGAVGLFGENASRFDRNAVAIVRRRIGVVHQDCQFLDHLPLAENIALPLTVAGKDPAGATANLDELLTWTGLSHRAGALPPELSGGERQRAALARAVILSPDIVLADEPTGNVDNDMSERLLRLLIELNLLGKTVLMATHDLGLIRRAKAQVAARVLRLRNRSVEVAGVDL
ncbi:MAG: ATP-binding cassette domain-containing protein [Pseudomonadota bacterium]